MERRNFFAFMMVLLSIFVLTFGGGCLVDNDHSSNFTPAPPPPNSPTDELNDSSHYLVTFDSLGGSSVESQIVEAGSQVIEPDIPENGSLHFIGWYPKIGFTQMFNFNSIISSDITLYAKWYDENDTRDSDGDGLSDSLEATFGTDPDNIDTDDDGLTDYDELNWLGYNPLLQDTDGNGVLDGDEDLDADGLSNLQEANFNTSMLVSDTDNDGLSDYDEVYTYHTDPLKPDTDNDGVKDGLEVVLGTDPLKAETEFTTSVGSDFVAEGNDNAIDISVNMISGADGAGTLAITPADRSDHPMISSGIPGYLGAAWNVTADSSFNSAEITFTVGKNVGTIGEDFQPRIYYLNEETGRLEELPNQTITSDGKISARITHFSIYILLNKIAFDLVWSQDIRPPAQNTTTGEPAKLDIVFVIDRSGSMQDNDPQRLAIELPKNFITKLRDGIDKAAVVAFEDYARTLQGLTTDKTALNSALDSIHYNGGTDGTQGIYNALEEMKASAAEYKYIIFLTDGEDTSRAYSYDTLIQTAADNGIIIYTIGMGYAQEDILREIASGTGGIYYKATAGSSSDEILELEEIYSQIEGETIDLTTDSNNDGISDYYTKMLNDGTMRLSNGSSWLVGVTDIYGEDNPDWDGDGLKNGEEIVIRMASSGDVYAEALSDPLLWDTDFDGYSDYEEVKNMKTSPLLTTLPSPNASSVNSSGFRSALVSLNGELGRLMDDTYFSDENVRKYLEFSKNAGTNPFDINKVQQMENALIDYFSTYTTISELSKDMEAASRLTVIQYIIDGLTLASDLAQTTKSIIDFGADLGSGKYNQASFDKEARDGIKHAWDVAISVDEALKSTRTQDLTVLNKIARAVTPKKVADDAPFVILEILSRDLNGIASATKEFISSNKESIEVFIKFSDNVDNSKTWLAKTDEGVKAIGKFVGGIKSIFNIAQKVHKFEIKGKWQWAENLNKQNATVLHNFKNGKELTHGAVAGALFSVIIDEVGLITDILKLGQTYGQIAVNFAEFQKYLEVLQYIADESNGFSPNLRKAAQNIADKFSTGSPDWNGFNDRVRQLAMKDIVLTQLTAVIDVGIAVLSAAHPAIGIAISVAKALYSFSGIDQREQAVLNAQAYYGITKASDYLIRQLVVKRLMYHDCIDQSEVEKYIVQLAQGRIVGLNSMMEYLLQWNLLSLFDRGLFQKGQVKEEYTTAINEVYGVADQYNLSLSEHLPHPVNE